MKALLQGTAGNYRLRGAIWQLSPLAYRAYVRLVPPKPPAVHSRLGVFVDGVTLQEVLGAAKERVKAAIGTPVEMFEVIPRTVSKPDAEPSTLPRRIPRRYPPPTD